MAKKHQLYKEILDIVSSGPKPVDKIPIINRCINKYERKVFCVGAGCMLLFMAFVKVIVLLFFV